MAKSRKDFWYLREQRLGEYCFILKYVLSS
jgi:hypothetical protein